MGTHKSLARIFILLCFSFSTAQEVHRISLKIDTKNAVPEKALHWSAGQNTAVLYSGEEGSFTIFARVGDEILWEAVSLTDPSVPIHLESLNYVSGPRIFSRNRILPDETLEATVIMAGNENYLYQLNFRIGENSRVITAKGQIRAGE